MLKSHEGKKIICHFGLSTKNKKVSLRVLLLQLDHQSKKDQSQCPLKIMFSHQGNKAYMKKPDIFSHAKITTVVTEHTCGMFPSNMWLNHPSEDSGGHLGVNLYGMKDIMFLSQKSHVACNVPCPIMENYILGWRGISAQYVNNFHKHVLLFLLQTQTTSIHQPCFTRSCKRIQKHVKPWVSWMTSRFWIQLLS